MPNPENFTTIQRFRLDDDTWRAFGELVGDRQRSGELKAFVEWRIGKPGARLPVPQGARQRYGFVVWVDDENDRLVEVHELPGAAGGEELRAGIEAAIQRHLAAGPGVVDDGEA